MRWIVKQVAALTTAGLIGWLALITLSAPALGAGADAAIVLTTIAEEARPVLELKLNGRGPYRFFVDTGAGGNVLSAALAQQLDLESLGQQQIFNPPTATIIDAEVVRVAEARNGDLVLTDLVFLAADLPPLGDKDGVLSVRSLPPGLVTFDFAAKRIRIEGGAFTEDEPGVMPYEPVPVVSLRGEVEGRELTFHLDTGSPDGITLPGDLARELTFSGELRTTREKGPLVVKTGQLRGKIRIGDLLLENPEVQVVDLYSDFGNIGIQFLQDKVLTVDRNRRLLRIVEPSR
jgi:predicted aspartyl protease